MVENSLRSELELELTEDKDEGEPESSQVPVSKVNHEAAESLPRPVSYQTSQTLDQPRLGLWSGLVSCRGE